MGKNANSAGKMGYNRKGEKLLIRGTGKSLVCRIWNLIYAKNKSLMSPRA